MKWLSVSVLGVGLLAACDKTVPFENTSPIKQGTTTTPGMDAGSFVLLDASLGPSDGAMAPEIADEKFTKPELLRQIADCALGRFKDFNTQAAALQAAVAAYGASPTDATRAAAQAAWRVAMSSWQQAELFSFGPSGPGTTTDQSDPGGLDLRNNIYFFPNINLCLVDQTIANSAYTKQPLTLNVSARGLGALEYLLFSDAPTNECSPALAINTGSPSPWAAIAPADLAARRVAFTVVLANDLAATAKQLFDAWDPTAGNFYQQFAKAGTSDSKTYASDQDAFNVVDTALFYVDKQLKDYKLGIPAGLLSDCTNGTCPNLVEAHFAQQSNDSIVQNLHAFRLLFQGCGGNYTGLGFDDWLNDMNMSDLSMRILNATTIAQQAAAALPQPLEQLIGTNLPEVVSLHADILAIGNLLHPEFTTALNFELPTAAAGDND